ncbi:MAG: hypothetical protein IJV77_06485 [Clostridia bacterium]|nr:hypothetical protein [Clostridia bacterium]
MKPFLCTDITYDKKSKVKNGQNYACGCPDEAYAGVYKKICNQLNEIQKENGKKLMVWSGVSCLFTTVWFAIFYYLIIVKDLWFDNMFNEQPVLSAIMIVFFVLAYGIMAIALKRAGKYKKSSQYRDLIAKKDNALDAMYEDMRVSNDAVKVDIITFNYKTKDGKNIPKGNVFETVPYRFSPYVLWGEDKFLHLANHEQKYAFEKKYFSKISYKNEYISMVCEDRYFDGKKAKERGLTQSGGYYSSKPYFVLEYDDGIEQVAIYYTNFNSDAFAKITGIQPKEDISKKKAWRN